MVDMIFSVKTLEDINDLISLSGRHILNSQLLTSKTTQLTLSDFETLKENCTVGVGLTLLLTRALGAVALCTPDSPQHAAHSLLLDKLDHVMMTLEIVPDFPPLPLMSILQHIAKHIDQSEASTLTNQSPPCLPCYHYNKQ